MCYQLWIASPLSLTEVRSMLPPGFVADSVPAQEQARLRAKLAGAQAIARLLPGGCACALRLARDGEDERHLRRRYAELGLSRERIIAALERHRRTAAPRGDPAAWRVALAGFVAEHARNAGATLYYLGFGVEPSEALKAAGAPVQVTAAQVRSGPDAWLEEGRLVEVTR